MYKNIKAVLSDLDGVLIDSISIYYKLLADVFEQIGIPQATHQTLSEAIKDGDFNWDAVLPDKMHSQKDEIVDRARSIISIIAPPLMQKELRLIPGADEILKRLAAEGLKIGLVTSTRRDDIKVKLEPLRNAAVEKLIEVIITTDDVNHQKPSAEPLLLCAQKLGVIPDNCVYIGDMHTDIRAGKAAAMRTIGVLTGFDDYQTLKAERPDVIIKSIRELPAALYKI
ncbi:HAD family phosphatase [Desulfococcaceae bacterium HSG7]|nr:HAD family phosphatase [Desulfococcaceae bacterium HSG7]